MQLSITKNGDTKSIRKQNKKTNEQQQQKSLKKKNKAILILEGGFFWVPFENYYLEASLLTYKSGKKTKLIAAISFPTHLFSYPIYYEFA